MRDTLTLLPRDLGPVHFIGIGGIGMSGIAEILLGLGYRVQGSDARDSAITQRLRDLGASVHIGQAAEHLGAAGVVVASSAIKPGNPELDAARARGLPVVRRAAMLAELMRLRRTVCVAGTHGKTTTTTMVAALLDAGGVDPTVINGGVIHAYGSNARLGQGDWVVAEADESDGSFNLLPRTVAIVTNIDPEHMDHWGDFDALRQGFRDFLGGVPFYGRAICCIDQPELRALIAQPPHAPLVTFGFDPEADIRAVGLRHENGIARFDIHLQGDPDCPVIAGCTLPMPGDHNVSNALAAVAVARHAGVSGDAIRAGLAGFGGVGRRFTKVAEVGGVTIIDDYGHHPVEIAAVIRAARQASQGRIIAVHQPHRYTRLASLFDAFARCFAGADVVAIAPIYSAGEDPIPGVGQAELVAAIAATGQSPVRALAHEDDLEALVRAHARPGDMVVCLGAGTISAWAYGLPARLT
jgi:UDP-N-acetylmuramate--alanine ligase